MPTKMENERTVAFGQVNEEQVIPALSAQGDLSANAIAKGVPQFIRVEDYTTFVAEWMMQDGNIVVHFFPLEGTLVSYWTVDFPAALDRVAQEVFKATAPRLQAKYTEELRSWWLRALKYDHVISVSGLMETFFDSLDHALDQTASVVGTQSPVVP